MVTTLTLTASRVLELHVCVIFYLCTVHTIVRMYGDVRNMVCHIIRMYVHMYILLLQLHFIMWKCCHGFFVSMDIHCYGYQLL